jgi:hypothetical protein
MHHKSLINHVSQKKKWKTRDQALYISITQKPDHHQSWFFFCITPDQGFPCMTLFLSKPWFFVDFRLFQCFLIVFWWVMWFFAVFKSFLWCCHPAQTISHLTESRCVFLEGFLLIFSVFFESFLKVLANLAVIYQNLAVI